MLFKFPYDHHLEMELKGLTLLKKLAHHKVRNAALKLACSIGGMLVGVYIAHEAKESSVHIVQLGLDALGYSIHGVMLFPIAKWSEPLWMVFGE